MGASCNDYKATFICNLENSAVITCVSSVQVRAQPTLMLSCICLLLHSNSSILPNPRSNCLLSLRTGLSFPQYFTYPFTEKIYLIQKNDLSKKSNVLFDDLNGSPLSGQHFNYVHSLYCSRILLNSPSPWTLHLFFHIPNLAQIP